MRILAAGSLSSLMILRFAAGLFEEEMMVVEFRFDSGVGNWFSIGSLGF